MIFKLLVDSEVFIIPIVIIIDLTDRVLQVVLHISERLYLLLDNLWLLLHHNFLLHNFLLHKGFFFLLNCPVMVGYYEVHFFLEHGFNLVLDHESNLYSLRLHYNFDRVFRRHWVITHHFIPVRLIVAVYQFSWGRSWCLFGFNLLFYFFERL